MSFSNYYQYMVVGVRKKIIPFTATTTPSIPNYSIYTSKYGEYPQVELYEIDGSGNRIKRSDMPYFILDSYDRIESISFGTLSDPITGFILLQ